MTETKMTEYEQGYTDGYKNASKAVAEWMNDSDVQIDKLVKLYEKLKANFDNNSDDVVMTFAKVIGRIEKLEKLYARLIGRDAPKKPIMDKKIVDSCGNLYTYFKCPECKGTVITHFCPNCGQRLEWKDGK